ncbi:hypothetical protein [Streptomyces albicerus]|uniref:hypothetical protein n=1 Tax=Streptomyces albicerus TaxID=2569859 RepID=UPI00124BA962|nr:hypothetical protein [Streptomyces albicerus]
MDVHGAVFVILTGPVEELEAAIATIQTAGITVEKDPDRGPNVIATWFSDGTDRPAREFIEQCVARTVAAAQGTGFAVGEPGVWASNAATRKLSYNSKTGEFLGFFYDTDSSFSQETLLRVVEERGMNLNDIELRDPPEFEVPLD